MRLNRVFAVNNLARQKWVNSLSALAAIALTAFSTNVSADEAVGSPLAGMAPLIGVWDFSDEIVAKRPEMGDLHHYIFEWGPQKNSIKLWEMVRKDDRDAVMMQGFIMRHPSQGHIVFYGSNSPQNFLFEGEYRVTGENTWQRLYTVHYPTDFDLQYLDPTLPGLARQFREELELSEDGKILTMKTSMWSNGEWTSFPPGFPPLVMVRVE